MDKLKMAHEVALAMIKNGTSVSSVVWDAWQYADEMQAEADERKEAEAQKGDDEVNQIISDWQPDWSQAPEWANWWAADASGVALFYSYEPSMADGYDYWGAFCGQLGRGIPTSNFGYKGDWRESLRKRP